MNDLADQSQVLVQTIEDLQKEADHKVSNWDMKLRSSDRVLDVRFYKCFYIAVWLSDLVGSDKETLFF